VTTVKPLELQELLQQGAERARLSAESVLVSQAIRVPLVDPLSFFSCGKKDRFFWRDPEEKAVVAGSGIAYRLQVDPEDRFEKIEQARQMILRESIIDADPSVPACGPVFFGGFSFDPLKVKTRLWRSFPDAELVLPECMLTTANGETWLTVNAVIDKDTDSEQEATRLLKEKERLLAESRTPGVRIVTDFTFSVTEVAREQWLDVVGNAAREMRDGLYEKVVLCRELRLEAEDSFSPTEVLYRLREEQPKSFLFAVQHGESCFLGASPERLVKREGSELLSACLAGTTARGKTSLEDEELGNRLLQDRKNRYEHQLVVDMIKNAMEQVCPVVDVPTDPVLYKMRDVQHLYTPVIGRASKETSLLSLVELLHPTPALGGFPRQKALEKIRQVEQVDRGWYGAPVGWIDYKGDGEFAVAIRSGLLEGKRASLFAGNGMVADSEPESEYRETQMKFKPMLSALGGSRS
jgi:menaquinone-specific isochorismate synthase